MVLESWVVRRKRPVVLGVARILNELEHEVGVVDGHKHVGLAFILLDTLRQKRDSRVCNYSVV